MVPTLFCALTLAVLYWLPTRRWFGRWGSTAADLTRDMAGDSARVSARFRNDHAA